MPFELLLSNIISPAVLAFFLGFAAIIFKSDLKLPDGLYQTVSVYLLLSLGIKGGAALRAAPLFDLVPLMTMALVVGMIVPCVAFYFSRFFGFSKIDSSALAAHYGSVSVVTFMTCQLFLDQLGIQNDRHMVALVALMEVPGLVIGLMFDKKDMQVSWWYEMKNIMLSKSIFLLLGGLLMGYISGEVGYQKVKPFFVDPFQGILVLFMLEMGVLAASKILELNRIPKKIIILGLLLPLINAALMILFCWFIDASVGNTTLLAAIAASASYIAAPAAVRIALPQANPAYYLTAAIVITFPFNLCIGIPLYYYVIRWFF
ncbi:MAG: hypothetical protein CNLJKLNK_01366 [Holosporales bacterium]